MKKIITMVLASLLAISSIVPIYANSDNLTNEQKEQLIQLGYPRGYKYQLDDWYQEIKNYDPYDYGSFTHFGVLCNFVASMKHETNPNNLPEFVVVARGVYDEISNVHIKRQASMNGIWDSLTNRVESGNTSWNTYYKAATNAGLNSINPNHGGYWIGGTVINPIVDACNTQNGARKALIKAYTISFRKFAQGANPGSTSFRLTNLPSGYVYFLETSANPQYGQIRIGAFVHRKTY